VDLEVQELNKMSWKEWQEKEKAFLDTKDLQPFIKKDKSIYDIISDIEDAFEKEYKLEDCLFNFMDSYDVIDYLQKRYKDIRFYTYEEQRVL
jgi:DNA-binding transcriptional regulator GbsR (MarR family)